MALSSSDFRKLLDIIHISNSINDKKSMLSEVLKALNGLIYFDGAVSMPLDPATGRFKLDGTVTLNYTLEGPLLFSLYYAPLHPAVLHGCHTRANIVTRLTDIVAARRFSETEYSRDFQSRFNIFYEMNVGFGSHGIPVWTMGLHRSRRNKDFTCREKEIFSALVPHLSDSLHRIDILEAFAAAQDEGVSIVGVNGTPVYMEGIDDGDIRQIIRIGPVPSHVCISSRLSCYGLTKREGEIALLVVNGYSNNEIARMLCISGQTVRDHLTEVFMKIKVRSRGELTAKVLGLRKL